MTVHSLCSFEGIILLFNLLICLLKRLTFHLQPVPGCSLPCENKLEPVHNTDPTSPVL